MRLLAVALLGAGLVASLAACSASNETVDQAPSDMPPPDMPPGGYAPDIGQDQIGPRPGPAPEAVALRKAPSADLPCPDDGERLPLSGVCRGRAVAYMAMDELAHDAPAGCEWETDETPFADQVMLYRALACDGEHVALDYAGGAHAAELSYIASPLHPEAVPDPDDPMAHRPIVRVAAYYKNDDWRLKETIGSDAAIAKCEIRPAGPGYPESAKVIAPKIAGADCGLYAVSADPAAPDNFWIVREDWVYAFSLPKGPRDIDPASFTVVTPH